ACLKYPARLGVVLDDQDSRGMPAVSRLGADPNSDLRTRSWPRVVVRMAARRRAASGGGPKGEGTTARTHRVVNIDSGCRSRFLVPGAAHSGQRSRWTRTSAPRRVLAIEGPPPSPTPPPRAGSPRH